MRPCVVLLATVQPQHACDFLCKEKLRSDKEEEMPAEAVCKGSKNTVKFLLAARHVCTFSIQMKETTQSHNTKLCQAIKSPQLRAPLRHGLTQLNSSFTHSHKSERIFCS